MFGDEDFVQDSKYRSFMAAMEKALKNFEYSSDWPDLISALTKLNKVLTSHAHKYKNIPRRLLLTKRLSQCLHPSLPSGVHLKALETYDLVFKSIGTDRLSDDLFIYATGLFPLLNYAGISVKPHLLKIYESYLLPLEKNLVPCLDGFLQSILLGMEESADNTRSLALLDSIKSAVSPPTFYTVLWQCVLSVSKLRLPSINYFLANRDGIEGEDLVLVKHAIKACLIDSNILVQRLTLELLSTRCVLEKEVEVVKTALRTLLRRDSSLNRRLFNWLAESDSLLIDSIHSLLSESDEENYRILVYLFDKQAAGWEIVLQNVLLDVIRSLYIHNIPSNVATLFFSTLSPRFVWSHLITPLISNFTTIFKNTENLNESTLQKIDLENGENLEGLKYVQKPGSGAPNLNELSILTSYLLKSGFLPFSTLFPLLIEFLTNVISNLEKIPLANLNSLLSIIQTVSKDSFKKSCMSAESDRKAYGEFIPQFTNLVHELYVKFSTKILIRSNYELDVIFEEIRIKEPELYEKNNFGEGIKESLDKMTKKSAIRLPEIETFTECTQCFVFLNQILVLNLRHEVKKNIGGPITTSRSLNFEPIRSLRSSISSNFEPIGSAHSLNLEKVHKNGTISSKSEPGSTKSLNLGYEPPKKTENSDNIVKIEKKSESLVDLTVNTVENLENLTNNESSQVFLTQVCKSLIISSLAPNSEVKLSSIETMSELLGNSSCFSHLKSTHCLNKLLGELWERASFSILVKFMEAYPDECERFLVNVSEMGKLIKLLNFYGEGRNCEEGLFDGLYCKILDGLNSSDVELKCLAESYVSECLSSKIGKILDPIFRLLALEMRATKSVLSGDCESLKQKEENSLHYFNKEKSVSPPLTKVLLDSTGRFKTVTSDSTSPDFYPQNPDGQLYEIDEDNYLSLLEIGGDINHNEMDKKNDEKCISNRNSEDCSTESTNYDISSLNDLNLEHGSRENEENLEFEQNIEGNNDSLLFQCLNQNQNLEYSCKEHESLEFSVENKAINSNVNFDNEENEGDKNLDISNSVQGTKKSSKSLNDSSLLKNNYNYKENEDNEKNGRNNGDVIDTDSISFKMPHFQNLDLNGLIDEEQNNDLNIGERLKNDLKNDLRSKIEEDEKIGSKSLKNSPKSRKLSLKEALHDSFESLEEGKKGRLFSIHPYTTQMMIFMLEPDYDRMLHALKLLSKIVSVDTKGFLAAISTTVDGEKKVPYIEKLVESLFGILQAFSMERSGNLLSVHVETMRVLSTILNGFIGTVYKDFLGSILIKLHVPRSILHLSVTLPSLESEDRLTSTEDIMRLNYFKTSLIYREIMRLATCIIMIESELKQYRFRSHKIRYSNNSYSPNVPMVRQPLFVDSILQVLSDEKLAEFHLIILDAITKALDYYKNERLLVDIVKVIIGILGSGTGRLDYVSKLVDALTSLLHFILLEEPLSPIEKSAPSSSLLSNIVSVFVGSSSSSSSPTPHTSSSSTNNTSSNNALIRNSVLGLLPNLLEALLTVFKSQNGPKLSSKINGLLNPLAVSFSPEFIQAVGSVEKNDGSSAELVLNMKVLSIESLLSLVSTYLKQTPNLSTTDGHDENVIGVKLLHFLSSYLEKTCGYSDIGPQLIILLRETLGLPSPLQLVSLIIYHNLVKNTLEGCSKDYLKEIQDLGYKLLDSICNQNSEKRVLKSDCSPQVLETLNANLISLIDLVWAGAEEKLPVLSLVSYFMIYLKARFPLQNYVQSTGLLAKLSPYANLRKSWKKEAFELLLEVSFFHFPKECFRDWMKICDNLFSDKSAFGEFLARVSVPQTGSLNIFSSKETEYELRGMLLKRLAFVIYSSPKDQYSRFMTVIQERLAEAIKMPQTVPIIQSQVFLCFRVLLLRLSPQNLNSLWPIILHEVLQALIQLETDVQTHQAQLLDLYLQLCKLLQTALNLSTSQHHATNVFQMYRWTFVGPSNPSYTPHLTRIASLLELSAKGGCPNLSRVNKIKSIDELYPFLLNCEEPMSLEVLDEGLEVDFIE